MNRDARQRILNEIPNLERQIKRIQADIAERTETKGDKFKIKIGDKIFTERPAAEKALLGRVGKV